MFLKNRGNRVKILLAVILLAIIILFLRETMTAKKGIREEKSPSIIISNPESF